MQYVSNVNNIIVGLQNLFVWLLRWTVKNETTYEECWCNLKYVILDQFIFFKEHSLNNLEDHLSYNKHKKRLKINLINLLCRWIGKYVVIYR